MPRTTVNIDASVLRELKQRQRREGKSLGELVSELLVAALQASSREQHPTRAFDWTTSAMRARVDLEDKEELYRLLDGR